MGVDYMPNRPLPRTCDRQGEDPRLRQPLGWPGGHFLWYKLLRGDHKGDIIYVAETLKKLAPAGTKVAPGETIAKALPSGTGIEMGWANKRGETRAAPCYSEGMKTHSGQGDGPLPERARRRRRQQGEERARLPHRPALLDGP